MRIDRHSAVSSAEGPAPVMQFDRRSAISSAAGATFALSMPWTAYAAAPADYAGAKSALQAMIKADPDVGPTMVRLAWHSRCARRTRRVASST